jgi:WD40 repeat protein
LRGGTSEVRTAVFSPDGKTLASGNVEGEVKLWDVAAQKVVAVLKP